MSRSGDHLARWAGWLSLTLWAASLALPAYEGPSRSWPGWLVVVMTPFAVITGPFTPPGSALAELDNLLVPGFALVLITGGRLSPWPALAAVAIALLGVGPHEIGDDAGSETAGPGLGQAAWLTSALVLLASAALRRRLERAG